MGNYSFSSLRDLLKDLPTPTPKFTGQRYEHPYVTEMFGELYFGESPIQASIDELFPPPLPLSNPCPPQTHRIEESNGIEEEKEDAEDEEEKSLGEQVMAEDCCVYDIYDFFHGQGRLYPPPISSLKRFKTGKPYYYFQFDKKLDRLVPEEINLPLDPQGVTCAARDYGRLMLFANGDVKNVKDCKVMLESEEK